MQSKWTRGRAIFAYPRLSTVKRKEAQACPGKDKGLWVGGDGGGGGGGGGGGWLGVGGKGSSRDAALKFLPPK